MRLSWYSNAPWAPTGYGTQTAQVVRRLVADGHEVSILANYGLMGTILEWEGATVYPGGATQHSFDVIANQHRVAGSSHLITLFDVWPFRDELDGLRVVSWVPVDSSPVAPEIQNYAHRGHQIVAMSKWGQEEFAKVEIASRYIPHAIDLDVYKPTPSEFRRQLRIPDDAFLVVINAQNQTTNPDRKSWVLMLAAFSYFAKTHPDAYLYLHTHMKRQTGWDLGYWMSLLSMPPERVRAADITAYQSTGVSNEQMAAIYTASDVLLATSKGEGFGLPVIEAQACGTPVIVTDFSAQPELVGAGWKVKGQIEPYGPMGNFLYTPFIHDIVRALEEAYEARGSADLAAAAIAKAQEYDADKVYAESWRPLLAELEADLAPRKKVQNLALKKKKRK